MIQLTDLHRGGHLITRTPPIGEDWIIAEVFRVRRNAWRVTLWPPTVGIDPTSFSLTEIRQQFTLGAAATYIKR